MRSTYDFNDPGFLLIDEANRMNPLWFTETIRASNPCGEQPLPPGGACLLGSLNLASFVEDPFTDKARFNFAVFGQVVRVFSRMLDNVVEMNGLPLKIQREEILRKRRHGMGYLGLGSAMVMLGHKYGNASSVEFTDRVTRELAIQSWRAALELAQEKGPAPIMTEEFEVTPQMLANQPDLARDGIKVGDKLPGRVLHAKYSRYMQRIAEADPRTVAELEQIGARYSHATSLAPTGTMALGVANNVSNGIEPTFSHHYVRNAIIPGEKAKRKMEVLSYELLAYTKIVDPDFELHVDPDTGELTNLPACFEGTTASAPARGHIDVQAAAQKWIDSGISKTINVPSDIDYTEFKDLYMYAVENGLKGCTTFRFNPEVQQGVLVTAANLARTYYEFRLEDGSTLRARGDEMIEYDGGEYTAANLYEALKEGLYGKF